MSSPSSRFTMFRQPGQRYQRAKGLKVKHVLQIAIVTVVLTWVVYELNQSRKPADSQGQAYRDTVQDSSSLGRKVLKPEGEQEKFHLERERETPTDPDDTTTKSSLEENVDGSRTVEDADDQRDKDISDLDIEHVSDQGTYFEELKNEQARAEQEEVGEDGIDGDTEQDVDSQSLNSEVTTFSTEGRSDGDNYPASVGDGHKKAGHTTGATFMETFNADSVLKHKLDKLDEGQVGDTSRAHVDEKFDSAIDALKEATEGSGQNAGEEKNVDPNEEVSEKEVDEEALDVSEVSTRLGTAENNADSQSEVEDTEVNLAREQFDVNKEKLGVESREEFKVEEKVEIEEQKQAPEQQQVGEEEKPDDKHDTLSHVEEEHEPEEKKQEEELVEKKADNPQTEVESIIQPELKSDGAEVDISEKDGNQHEIKESLRNVAGDLDSSTQGSQGENKSLVQSEETDENKRRLATEKSIQDFQGTSAEEKKEEAQQNHGGVETQNGNESHQGDIEQKKDESAETNKVETNSIGAGDLSYDSNSKVEKHIQEDHSAETVNTDASKKEDSKQKDEDSKDEVLKQVTDSNAAWSGESDKKVEG